VTVCIKQIISSRDLRFESTVVIGDRSGRQMATKAHDPASEGAPSGDVQRLGTHWLCADAHLQVAPRLRNSWKSRMNAVRVRPAAAVGTRSPCRVSQRTYRCLTCGLVIDRDEHSAVNLRERFAFPALVHTRAIPWGVRVYSPQLKNVCSR
jgi:hypothetical protein